MLVDPEILNALIMSAEWHLLACQVGDVFNQLRLARQRFVNGHSSVQSFDDEASVNETLAQLLMVMEHLDDRIGPMLERDGAAFNKR